MFQIQKNVKASYSTYYKVFQRLNISFSRPSQDECDICEVWKTHEHQENHVGLDDCLICDEAKEHLDSARVAREH